MKKAIVLGIMAFFAINIATVQQATAQDKKPAQKAKVEISKDQKATQPAVKECDKKDNASCCKKEKEEKTTLKCEKKDNETKTDQSLKMKPKEIKIEKKENKPTKPENNTGTKK